MWYKHDSIKSTWIVEKLYGENSNSNRSKFYQRMAGKIPIEAEEEIKLNLIRKSLLNELEAFDGVLNYIENESRKAKNEMSKAKISKEEKARWEGIYEALQNVRRNIKLNG